MSGHIAQGNLRVTLQTLGIEPRTLGLEVPMEPPGPLAYPWGLSHTVDFTFGTYSDINPFRKV